MSDSTNTSLYNKLTSAADKISTREKLILGAKWSVYALLFVNFGLYLSKDLTAAQFTITADTNVMGWLSSFAASMDQFAWVMLIFIYEMETYWLEDDFDNKLIEGLMLAGKIVFVGFILNTIVSYSYLTLEMLDMSLVESAKGGLCAFAGEGISFLRNLEYVEITTETCASIPHEGQLFRYPNDPIITDAAGQVEDLAFRVLDLVESVVWFLILGLTELSVRLQDKGIHKGALVDFDKIAKTVLYLIIVGISVFWWVKGHYMYVWDEALWIASFVALDGNLSAWREELADADQVKNELQAGKPEAATLTDGP